MIQMSEKAVEKVRELSHAENKEGFGLRVAVQGGGCSGFQYGLTFENAERPNDPVLDMNGLKTYGAVTPKTSDKDWTFTIDSKTLVLGQGMGTITRKFEAEGKKPTIVDLLGVNDEVVVYFKDAANAKLATEIRVLRKGSVK